MAGMIAAQGAGTIVPGDVLLLSDGWRLTDMRGTKRLYDSPIFVVSITGVGRDARLQRVTAISARGLFEGLIYPWYSDK